MNDKLDKIIAYWEERRMENIARSNRSHLSPKLHSRLSVELGIIEDTLEQLRKLQTEKGDYRKARGVLPFSPDDRLPEEVIRRLRGEPEEFGPSSIASVQHGLEDAKQGRVSKVDLS